MKTRTIWVGPSRGYSLDDDSQSLPSARRDELDYQQSDYSGFALGNREEAVENDNSGLSEEDLFEQVADVLEQEMEILLQHLRRQAREIDL